MAWQGSTCNDESKIAEYAFDCVIFFKQVNGWMRSWITGSENQAAEFGLEKMRQTHPEATLFCKKKRFASADKSIRVSNFFFLSRMSCTFSSDPCVMHVLRVCLLP
jgi:hypothetical protein